MFYYGQISEKTLLKRKDTSGDKVHKKMANVLILFIIRGIPIKITVHDHLTSI